jgi:hypothetical protein
LLLLSVACGAAMAEDHAIGIKAGLLGIGIEYGYQLTERVVVRGGINGSGFSFDETESGINYDFELNFDSIAIGVDVHPMRGPFRVSGGLLKNDSALRARGVPAGGSYDIGDSSYNSSEIGSLRGSIEFDSTAPYIAIGWDWLREKRVGVTFEMGVADQGPPTVALNAFGPIASDPDFLGDLAAEDEELRASVDDLDTYPYASFGVVFRF